MSTTPARARNSAPLVVLGLIALVVGTIGTCAYVFLAPEGQRVGEIDLTAASASTHLTLRAASTLHFRLDATLPLPTNEPSSRSARNAVYDTLGESHLTFTATREGSTPRTVRCAAYDGRFVSASDTETEVAVQGIPLTCELRDVPAGRHVVTASVQWARGVIARHAVVEMRAEPR